jgi:hypothetical protein
MQIELKESIIVKAFLCFPSLHNLDMNIAQRSSGYMCMLILGSSKILSASSYFPVSMNRAIKNSTKSRVRYFEGSASMDLVILIIHSYATPSLLSVELKNISRDF